MTTTEARVGAGFDDEAVEIVEPDPERYVRAAGDVIQVGLATALFLVTLLTAALLRAIVSGAQQDVTRFTSLVPAPVSELLTAVVSIVAYLGPWIVVVELAVIRRLRLAFMVVGAGLLAWGAMWLVSQLLSMFVITLPAGVGELQPVRSTDAPWIAAAAAVVTCVNPWLPRILRRVGIGTVVAVVITGMATGAFDPYEAAVAATLGWLCGSAVLAAVGSVNRRPRGIAVARALATVGIPVARLEMIGGGLRGSTLYRADTPAGERRFVKVFDPNQRETDMLVQFYRWVRLREPGQGRPFSSLRRAVEHEALVSLAVAHADVPTPELVAVGEIEPDAMVLALEYVDGDDLTGAGAARIDDELLRRIWQIHALMRANHIAHRELHLDHVLLRGDGTPVVVNFSSGQVAASADLLAMDTAELLCSTAIEVGHQRAVAAAADVLGRDVLGHMIGHLQPLALTRHTRRLLNEHSGLLTDLQEEVQRVAGVEQVEYEELARLQPRTLLTIVVLAVAAYVLLNQVASDTRGKDVLALLGEADWVWAVPLIACMASTWVGAAVGMVGSVPDRVPFFRMLKTQVAASFVDLLAPAALGGMALTTRFLQKRGIDSGVAVAGVGLNAVAGFVAHVLILGIFVLWAGGGDGAAGGTPPIETPGWQATALVVIGLLALIGGAWAVPAARRLVRTRFVVFMRDAIRGVHELSRKPEKLVALVGGSGLVTLGLYGALYCSVRVFADEVSAADIGVAYLIASTVTIIALTPGAVGPLELALTPLLARTGLGESTALNAVVLFRLGTFWLPVLPGWIAFRSMQSQEEV